MIIIVNLHRLYNSYQKPLKKRSSEDKSGLINVVILSQQSLKQTE